jgi:hypothetical protein
MVEENTMTVTVVAEQGSHLLIADGERYAVVERREDHHKARDGIPAKDLSAARRILDDAGMTGKPHKQRSTPWSPGDPTSRNGYDGATANA